MMRRRITTVVYYKDYYNVFPKVTFIRGAHVRTFADVSRWSVKRLTDVLRKNCEILVPYASGWVVQLI